MRNETVTAIFVTHTHRDHSPAVPAIKAATGATVYAEGPHRAARPLHIGEMNPLDSSGDRDFRPDVALKDGEVVAGDGWTVEAVTTPGHTANHMAFAFKEKNLLFAGDHVMGWATSIVAPPDGAMSDYMASLNKLAKRGETIYFPGHGPAIRDASRFVNYYILHRKAREASILHRLAKGETDIPSIVRAIYIGIDPRLTGAAGLSVLAHLEDLVTRGLVETDGMPAIDGDLSLGRRPLGRLQVFSPARRAARAPNRPRRRYRRAGCGYARHWRRNRASRSARPSAYRRARRRPVALMRITTSSRKPMISVRATASITASRRPADGGRASTTCHLRLVTSASVMS